MARRRRHVRGPLADRPGSSSSGTFATGTTADIDDAVAAARRAQPAWAATPWQERLAILRRAAELISDRLMDYSAAMSYEVGKNRIESLGEVEESADLIRYYAQTMEDNGGYDHPMGNLGDAAVHTRSILRPHGVFAVVVAVQLPDGARHRSVERGDDGRQHRRHQAVPAPRRCRR